MGILVTLNSYKEYKKLAMTETEVSEFWLKNGSFEIVDAEVAYAMVRTIKPKKSLKSDLDFR